MPDGNVHANHRERVKNKFSDFGFEGWYDHEVLEMMLFYAIPRCDTNPIAHALLKEFGTLSAVLDADVEQLKRIPGIGESAAIYISALGKLQSVYNRSKWNDAKTVFSNVTATGLFCADFIGNETEEVLALICLDSQKCVKKSTILSRGVIDKVHIDIRKIVEHVVSVNAKHIVLCHNHPSGVLQPSYEDIEMTKRILLALSPLEIELVDHIIVCGKGYTSMAERGLLEN